MGMSPLNTPVDRSAPNLAERVSSPTWSTMTIFLAIGLGVSILWGVEFCYFPISRRSPLTQCLRYRTACDTQCSVSGAVVMTKSLQEFILMNDVCRTASVIYDFCFALQSTSVSVFQRRWQLVYIYGFHHQPTDWRHSWSTNTWYTHSTSIATATAAGAHTQQSQSQWEFWPTAKACPAVDVDYSDLNTVKYSTNCNVMPIWDCVWITSCYGCCTRSICQKLLLHWSL